MFASLSCVMDQTDVPKSRRFSPWLQILLQSTNSIYESYNDYILILRRTQVFQWRYSRTDKNSVATINSFLKRKVLPTANSSARSLMTYTHTHTRDRWINNNSVVRRICNRISFHYWLRWFGRKTVSSPPMFVPLSNWTAIIWQQLTSTSCQNSTSIRTAVV